jgi:dUTP pyrophosphatase
LGERAVTAERATIRILRLRSNARLPERQSEHASGYDLHACLEAPLTVGSMPVRVPTGIAVAAPPGTDVQIRPRSGLFSRGVIGMLGTVDADFRGELHVTLYCLAGVGEFTVRDGDRIAQLVIARLAATELEEVDALDDTERGAGGHGSTGLR